MYKSESVGSGALEYGAPIISQEELQNLRKNYKCEISNSDVQEAYTELIELGAQPTEEDLIELICAKGYLEFDRIKHRIYAKADIRPESGHWMAEYDKRIKKLEEGGYEI